MQNINIIMHNIYGLTEHLYTVLKGCDWPDYSDFLEHGLTDDLPSEIITEIKGLINNEPSYHKNMFALLKHKFTGADLIRSNYSQSWQDMFALTMLDGKRGGCYLELGAFEPTFINNTYLLTLFGYDGVSIELDDKHRDIWHEMRPDNTCIFADVFDVDIADELKNYPAQIDYLQVDIDPEQASYEILTKLPHNTHRFSVITFETDIMNGDYALQTKSRAFLKDLGYELVVSNVGVWDNNTWLPFEDWYVDPTVIDRDIINKFKDISDSTKLPHLLFSKIDNRPVI